MCSGREKSQLKITDMIIGNIRPIDFYRSCKKKDKVSNPEDIVIANKRKEDMSIGEKCKNS